MENNEQRFVCCCITYKTGSWSTQESRACCSICRNQFRGMSSASSGKPVVLEYQIVGWVCSADVINLGH